jgi:transporter family protein
MLATILLMIASSILGAFGVLFFKFASKKVSFDIFSWIFNLKFIIGALFYGFSFILLIIALKLADLSIVYPLYALNYVWVALLSHYVLREKIYFKNWIGFILIVIGIALTTIK